MALIKQSSITAWYTAQGSNTADLAKEAYDDAVKFFEQSLTQSKDKRDWIRAQTTLEDVVQTVQQARSIYEQYGHSEARRSISAFASRVQYYGGVLDVLAQHHPEYVALVWGAIKFVFTGVLNHAELVTELSKALTNVADVLPHVELGINLYPTKYMKEAVTRVYAHIMLFLEKAMRWYQMSPARRAWTALASPYAIGYKDTVNQIRSCTESIHLLASAAARAELRDQTVLLKEHKIMLQELDKTLKETRDNTQHICKLADASQIKFDHVLHISEGTYEIANKTWLGVSEQNARLQDIQFSEILDAMKPRRMPEDVLCACKSVAQRRQLWRAPTQESVQFVQSLNLWINAQEASLFILQAGLRAEARAKDLALQATTLLQESQQTVFWYFSERCADDVDFTLSDIFKSLIFQILVRCPNIVHAEPQLLSISSFKTQHIQDEWLELLNLLLRRVEACFLVVEVEYLLERLGASNRATEDIYQIFGDLINKLKTNGAQIKILLVCAGPADGHGKSSGTASDASFRMCVRQPRLPAKRNLARRSAAFRAAHSLRR